MNKGSQLALKMYVTFSQLTALKCDKIISHKELATSIYFWCIVVVFYSHKLKRKVELNGKILEILKNLFGQFYQLNNDNSISH